jgi:hypothetical protein
MPTNASILADWGSGIGTAGPLLRLDTVNDRVGIGTTNPTETLDVGGNIRANNASISGVVTSVTINTTNLNSTNASISGVVTSTLVSAVDASISGVVTSSSFVGNLTGNADSADTATYSSTAGIATIAENLTGTPNITVGFITASSAAFSGNVSVAGTLTYEDVTNIDSIGLVTARSGINVTSGGINAVGVITATSDIKIGTKSVATSGKSIALSMIFG